MASPACDVCELLPYTAKMVDDMCFIRSMHTEAINHEPAISFMQTGNQVTGRPCLGAWASYGLGAINKNLPDLRRPRRQADQPGAGAGDFRPAVGLGLSLRRACRRLLPHGRRSDPLHQQPARRVGRGPPQNARRPEGAQRDELQDAGRSGNADAHSAVRDGLPHADERARADRPRQRAGKHVQALWRRGQEGRARSRTRCCWRGGWSSAACASCRSITTTGTRTATSPADCPTSAATSTRPATA